MARANRHYIPGCLWHITHRCHKKEFLLKFDRDQRRWLKWLFEARGVLTSLMLLLSSSREISPATEEGFGGIILDRVVCWLSKRPLKRVFGKVYKSSYLPRSGLLEPRRAADCLQRTLLRRSRFRQRLTPGVR